VVEARLAKKLIKGSATNEPPVTDGVQGTGLYGETISFVMLGDSTAAGVGVDVPEETAAARLASGLAMIAERPVHLTNVAISGSRSERSRTRSPGPSKPGPTWPAS